MLETAPVKRARRRLVVGAASLAGSLVAALVLGELLLRATGRFRPDPPWYPGDHVAATTGKGQGVFDEAVGWKLAPGQVVDETPDFRAVYTIGADGFRTALGSPVDPDAPTLVFVGDSFTFGTGVDDGETFVERTSVELGALPLNLGMAGFGVDQMWRALHHYGLEREPDLVVATFVVDDLNRSLTAYRYRGGWIPKPTYTVRGGELVPMDEGHRPPAPVRWVQQRTHLAELARRISNRLGSAGARWRLNRALFAAMRDECRAADVPLVVVHIPHRGRWRASELYRRELEALGIPSLDLGGLSVERPRELYFPKDPHLNARGHSVVARALAGFLRERGLVGRGRDR